MPASIPTVTATTTPKAKTISDFQVKVYTLLQQIPRGQVTTYGHLARALHTSARAVGGALRNNPFAPEVPCHRVITANGWIGGFLGECEVVPSGVNQTRKRELLEEEGVVFDDDGHLAKVGQEDVKVKRKGLDEIWFDGPWDLSGKMARSKTR